jgi:DNA-binding MarR family transcriptional regulator
LSGAWQRLADAALATLDVSNSQGWALVHLARLGAETRQADLARAIGITEASLVRTLHQLEHSGYVARRPDPDDALRETETAHETYARARDETAALARARDSAAVSAAQAGKLFRFGRGDFLSVLEAQSGLAQAEAAHAAAEARLVDDQIALFMALGGGWR